MRIDGRSRTCPLLAAHLRDSTTRDEEADPSRTCLRGPSKTTNAGKLAKGRTIRFIGSENISIC